MQTLKLNAKLTIRQNQILEAVAVGYTSKEIAIMLYISESTVNNHIAKIKELTGCKKQTQLSALYFYRKFRIPIDHLMHSKILPVLFLILLTGYQLYAGTDMIRRAPRRGRRGEDIEVLDNKR